MYLFAQLLLSCVFDESKHKSFEVTASVENDYSTIP